MARTDDQWEPGDNNTYIQTTLDGGYNILLNGLNKYLNFNSLVGYSGYGIRDNSGVMEFKNSGGAWGSLGGLTKALADIYYVPYTGANADVYLGSHNLKVGFSVKSPYSGFNIGVFDNTDGNSYIEFLNRPDGGGIFANPGTDPSGLTSSFFAIVNGYNTNGFAKLNPNLLTNEREFIFPDASGTIALTSNIPSISGLVPYTGATTDLNLGVHNLATTGDIETPNINALATQDINFFATGSIGNSTDGHSLYIWRNAPEGDDNFQLYVDQYRRGNIVTTCPVFQMGSDKEFQIASDQGFYGGQALRLNASGNSNITMFDSASSASHQARLTISGRKSDNILRTMTVGVNYSVANQVDFTGLGAYMFDGVILPQQHATIGAPTYQKGAIYFDTTLNKLRVGGATGWETITSL